MLFRDDHVEATYQHWGFAPVRDQCGDSSVSDWPPTQLTATRWAYKEDIPYVRAVRHIPRWAKDRLPATYLMALDTKVRI